MERRLESSTSANTTRQCSAVVEDVPVTHSASSRLQCLSTAPKKFVSVNKASRQVARRNRQRITQRITQRLGHVPIELGNFIVDPHDVFRNIGSPGLRNIDSLWYWLGVKIDCDDLQYGEVSGTRRLWGDLIVHRGPCDAAILSLLAYLVLRKLVILLGDSPPETRVSEVHLIRAKLCTLKHLKDYTHVTRNILVIISMLALDAASAGDVKAAKAHLNALKDLLPQCPSSFGVSEWILTYGVDVRLANHFMERPVLPYFVPNGMLVPLPLSLEEIRKSHELAAKNALALAGLLGGSYLQALKILERIHQFFIVFPDKLAKTAPPLGQIYTLGFECATFHAGCLAESSVQLGPCRELIAIVLKFGFWRASVYHVTHEGVLEFIALGRAKATISLAANLLMHNWRKHASSDSLIWILTTLTLASSTYRQQDLAFWTDLLRIALSDSEIKSIEDFQRHVDEWPYAPEWRKAITNTLLNGPIEANTGSQPRGRSCKIVPETTVVL